MEPAVAATWPDLDALEGSPARRELPDGPRVLVFTTLFPNPAQPRLGVFVRDRVAAVAAHCPTRVVAPVQSLFGRWIRRGSVGAIPVRDGQAGLEVYHPRFTTVPGIGRFADGLLLFLQTVQQVGRLRQEFPFDLIDAHYAFPDGAAAVLLGRHFGVPVCITVRGGDIDLLPRFRLRRRVIRWTLARAHRVIAVSRHMADGAHALGASSDNLRVVGNGVDLATFTPVEQAVARRRLGIPEASQLIVCVGNLTPEKGQHVLIDAVAVLSRSTQVGPRVAIIGSDQWGGHSYQQQLVRRANELGVAERVDMVGSKPQAELPLWYSAADVVVLPTFREGCPNVLREALACGAPVVASRVGGVPEVVASERFGLLVEPGDVSGLASAIGTVLGRRYDRTAIAAASAQRPWQSVGAIIAAEFGAVASECHAEHPRTERV